MIGLSYTVSRNHVNGCLRIMGSARRPRLLAVSRHFVRILAAHRDGLAIVKNGWRGHTRIQNGGRGQSQVRLTSSNMNSPVRAVLSLGGACVTAFAIGDFFNSKRQHSPFDWLVTPLNSAIKILDDDAKRIARSFKPIHGGRTALCKEYNVLYHHEFPREDGIIVFSSETLQSCRDKLTYKYKTFIAAASQCKTLFVRTGLATDVPGDPFAEGAVPASVINKLANSIETSTKRTDFRIAILLNSGKCGDRVFQDNIIADADLDPRVYTSPIFISDNYPDRGDSTIYAELFQRFELTPDSELIEAFPADSPPF
jgi:hypothetical protein